MALLEQKVFGSISASGGRITAADLSASTGMALHVATQQLNKIAALSHAVLEVSKSGVIVYVFPANLARLVEANGFKKKLKEIVLTIVNALHYLLRCSFGILLVVSFASLILIFIVVLLAIVLAAGAAGGHHGGHHHGGHHGHHHGILDVDFFDVESLLLFFVYQQDMRAQDDTYVGQTIELGDQGFLANCYSFLFGDGNPNQFFAERSWKYVAELIRLNLGVITAEQAAPYIEANALGEDRSMFPILVRFEGIPEVTENGNIVYAFPKMQVSANRLLLMEALPPFAEEKLWKFTRVPFSRLTMVLIFAVVNLAGWLALSHNQVILNFIQPYDTMVPFLVDYAAFFLVFPVFRELCNDVRNGLVDYRNKIRQRAYEKLATPELQAKVAEAQVCSQRLVVLNANQSVYTTAQDLLDQEIDRN